MEDLIEQIKAKFKVEQDKCKSVDKLLNEKKEELRLNNERLQKLQKQYNELKTKWDKFMNLSEKVRGE